LTDCQIEDEEIATVARDGLLTEVTVKMLPFIGNTPAGVTAVLVELHAVTLEALGIEKPVVLPAERPPEMSTARVNVNVWPAGIDKLRPENVNNPLFNEVYWARTWPFWTKYAPEIALSESTPVFWNAKLETVTAPELPAVRFTAITGTRAEPEFSDEIKEPAAGLVEAKLT
jgi:hypothetical protein